MGDKYLIVADDFTGANDTGVQLSRRGFTAEVALAGRRLAGESCLVLDTESRAMPPEAAARAVSRALEGLEPGDYKYLIKKVDSTLRGNVAAEVRAMDAALRPELIVFAPALPDLGRTTVNGIHRLKGVRITETELARDPKTPVREDDVSALLRQVYGEVRHVGLARIRQGELDLSEGRVFTFDAETNADMQAVISAARATGKRVLWVGTAAMADNIMELDRRMPQVFGVAASLSDVTAGQVKNAEAAGIRVVPVPFHRLLAGEEGAEGYVRACVDSLLSGRDTLLVSSSTLDRAELALATQAGRARGMAAAEVSAYVQREIGGMAARVLDAAPVSGIFLTGGDTAIGTLGALEADGSRILTEISVGIPMMRIVGGRAAGLKAATKAGAFGAPDAIAFAFRKLKEA